MKTRTPFAAVAAAALIALAIALPAAAAPPGRNDSIASPIVIGAIPYSNTQDTRRASIGATDPGFCFDPSAGADRNTVWYQYTATADARLAANTFGSSYDTTLYVGTPDGAGGLTVIGCTDDSAGDLQSYVGFNAVAGTTYLFMVGTCCGTSDSSSGGSLVFTLGAGVPPLVLDVTVAPTGTVDRGVVTLTGTATCSETTGFAVIEISLSQKVGQRSINGSGEAYLESCGPTPAPWTLVLEGSNGRFAGGSATGEVTLSTCGALECASTTEGVSIKLR